MWSPLVTGPRRGWNCSWIDEAVTDGALLLAARTDAEAFSQFYRRHAGAVLGYLARHQQLRAAQRGSVERRARDRLGMGRIELDDDELERILAFAESESTAVLLADALAALPPDQRALNARVLEEQEYDAIARSSGTAEATIRKRVSRALTSLRNALGEPR